MSFFKWLGYVAAIIYDGIKGISPFGPPPASDDKDKK
jgi:hypothetical protein